MTSDARAAHAPVFSAEPTARRFDSWWWLVAATAGLLALLVVGQPDPYRRILIFVSDGLAITLGVTLSSFGIVLALGLLGGLGRIAPWAAVRGLATLYVEIARGIPLLVQLYFWYFAFPALLQELGRRFGIAAWADYRANPVAMAIMGISLCYGAYMTEIVRAGIQSVPRGQFEAARSLGMSYLQAMRHVVLPQALRAILPAIGNEFTTLLKDSSLVSAVAVGDLTRRGREFMAQFFNPIESWLMIALLYLVMTLLAARGVAALERRSRVAGR
jgi:polar amino acid transport system permease protein